MNLQLEKDTHKNNKTIFSRPKLCNKCENPLRNMTALMMGMAWKCEKCDRTWHQIEIEDKNMFRIM